MGCQRNALDEQRCIGKSPHTDFSALTADVRRQFGGFQNITGAKTGQSPPQAHQETGKRPFSAACVALSGVYNMTIGAAIIGALT